MYKEFELQKVCYLPLNTFLLKPIQRLMHYKLILERLCKHYSPEHRDHHECKGDYTLTHWLFLQIIPVGHGLITESHGPICESLGKFSVYVYMCVSAEALKEVAEITAQLQSSLIRLENFQKLTELQRDLIGIENLTAPGRVRVMVYLIFSP